MSPLLDQWLWSVLQLLFWHKGTIRENNVDLCAHTRMKSLLMLTEHFPQLHIKSMRRAKHQSTFIMKYLPEMQCDLSTAISNQNACLINRLRCDHCDWVQENVPPLGAPLCVRNTAASVPIGGVRELKQKGRKSLVAPPFHHLCFVLCRSVCRPADRLTADFCSKTTKQPHFSCNPSENWFL